MRQLLRDLGRASTYRDFFSGVWEGMKDPETWLIVFVLGVLWIGIFLSLVSSA